MTTAATSRSEQIVLAHILFGQADPLLIGDVVATNPAVFTDPRHRTIWQAAGELISRGDEPTVGLVESHLGDTGRLGNAGGPGFFTGLASTIAQLVVEDAHEHFEMMVGLLRRTQGQELARQAQQRISEGEDPDSVMSWLQAAMRTIATIQAVDPAMLMRSVIDSVLHEIESEQQQTIPRIPTGWQALDQHLGGGFRPGNLVVVAARPGVGKSVVGVSWAMAAARGGHSVALFSLEMPSTEVGKRMIAARGYLPYTPMRDGTRFSADPDYNDELTSRMHQTAAELAQLPLMVDDAGGITMSRIRQVAAAFKRDQENAGHPNPLSLVVIDYLALVAAESGSRFPSRREFIEDLTRRCKVMARELGCAVVVLAQLNRGASNPPQLTDLRESGSYEQDADVVMLLWREDAVNTGGANPDPDLHCWLAKFRQGESNRDFARAWEGMYMTTADPDEGRTTIHNDPAGGGVPWGADDSR